MNNVNAFIEVGPAEHNAAIADLLPIAETFAGLHQQAVKRISVHFGPQPPVNARAVLAIASHAFNVYVSTLSLAVRGQFDVARYLVRPLFDCP